MNKLMSLSLVALGLSGMAIDHARAENIAYIPNVGGGQILLTDRTCGSQGYVALARNSDGETWTGCWISDETLVYVKWPREGAKPELRTYRIDEFKTIRKAPQIQPQAQQPKVTL